MKRFCSDNRVLLLLCVQYVCMCVCVHMYVNVCALMSSVQRTQHFCSQMLCIAVGGRCIRAGVITLRKVSIKTARLSSQVGGVVIWVKYHCTGKKTAHGQHPMSQTAIRTRGL